MTNILADNLNNIEMVYDKTSMKLYVNNFPPTIANLPIVAPYPDIEYLTAEGDHFDLGGYVGSSGYNFKGKIDSLIIY